MAVGFVVASMRSDVLSTKAAMQVVLVTARTSASRKRAAVLRYAGRRSGGAACCGAAGRGKAFSRSPLR